MEASLGRAGPSDPTRLTFGPISGTVAEYEQVIVIGTLADLTGLSGVLLPGFFPESVQWSIDALIARLSPGPGTESKASTPLPLAGAPVLVLGALPTSPSRGNSPALPHAISAIVKSTVAKSGRVLIVATVPTAEYAAAAVWAIASAFSAFTFKTAARTGPVVSASVIARDGSAIELPSLTTLADSIRFTAALVDMPTSHLNTDDFVSVARDVGAEVGADVTVFQRETLDPAFGGLWGVGKASEHPPALVQLAYTPAGYAPETSKTIVLVGKGIVYDTGGLSMKGPTSMPGMKRDMGGAAAVLGAFRTLSLNKTSPHKIFALLCLAENSVGPAATRPDDVITLYSGKTVEVNNTDAEGRLVLGDGVAYAVKNLNPTVILDMATLTGAQGIATGQKHGAIFCNNEGLEETVIAAGKSSGNLVHPLVYCPEFHRKEFASAVADMKNSVKDRSNAQSSCAGQFIGNHLGDFQDKGLWCHIDMAYPVHEGERATGYGVSLLCDIVGRL